MANITASDVKELRDMTGCGMMDCKRALVEADGNRDEAVKILREKGLAKAAKKAGRIAAEGVVKTKVNGNTGVIVEINCETDFCAKRDKAVEYLREKGLAKAAKKAGRIAAEGMAYAQVCPECGVGAVVEVNCETDFCAKSDKFLELVETIADTILANDVADVEALKGCTIAGGAQTVSEYMTEKIATIGENMNIRRFTKMEGTLVPYMHDGFGGCTA